MTSLWLHSRLRVAVLNIQLFHASHYPSHFAEKTYTPDSALVDLELCQPPKMKFFDLKYIFSV